MPHMQELLLYFEREIYIARIIFMVWFNSSLYSFDFFIIYIIPKIARKNIIGLPLHAEAKKQVMTIPIINIITVFMV